MSMLLMLYSLGNLHVVSWGTREAPKPAGESLNPFDPELLKCTLPSLNWETSVVANMSFCKKIDHRIANRVDPDEMVCFGLSS